MIDKLGNILSLGDHVAVATMSYKRASLREGWVKEFAVQRGVEVARVATEAGGSTWVREKEVISIR